MIILYKIILKLNNLKKLIYVANIKYFNRIKNKIYRRHYKIAELYLIVNIYLTQNKFGCEKMLIYIYKIYI